MELEERMETLEREKQRMELHMMMMEDTVLGMKRENKSLKEMFIELLGSCETISNHEKQFTDLQMKFKSLTNESETGSEEIKTIKTNLNALQNRDMKSFEKHAQHKKDIDKLKSQISGLEKISKEKEGIHESEKDKEACIKCSECVDLCVNISKEVSAMKDDKLFYSAQVEKYESLLADYTLTMDPQFSDQEIAAIADPEEGEHALDTKLKALEKKVGSLKNTVLRMKSTQDAHGLLQPSSLRSDSEILFMESLGLPLAETWDFDKPISTQSRKPYKLGTRKQEKPATAKKVIEGSEIIIGNVPDDCEDFELFELFSEYGRIVDITKITRKDAVISFESPEAVDAVMANKVICLRGGYRLSVEIKPNGWMDPYMSMSMD